MDGYERRVLSLADVVFVSAGNLLARVEKWFKGAHLIPNACNYSHFAGAKQLSEPGGLRGMPHPRVLFVGGIYGWLDIDLITKAAKELSDWAFVFVGPGGDDRLVRVPNITLLGPKPYAELPNYYGHTDAAIIPFALSDLTRGVNPIKVYEYLAAGLPVVATPLPELTAIASEIELASGVNEFVEALRRTQTVDVTSRVANRQAIARQNDWAERFKEMDRVLAPYLHEED
jgi:glycosyltransferase involved in cell wall biosynthesis